MDFRVFSQNLPEKMQARCVREDAEQALRATAFAGWIISKKSYPDTEYTGIQKRICPKPQYFSKELSNTY